MPRNLILQNAIAAKFPMRPDSHVPATTGTRLIRVVPDTGSIPGVAILEARGAGLVIVRGAGGFGMGGENFQVAPTITFLRGAELPAVPSPPVDGDELARLPLPDQTFTAPEVHDGAVLPGKFDRIMFVWGNTGGGGIRPAMPIWVRLIEPELGRAVYTAPGGPPRGTCYAVDWFVQETLVMVGTAAGGTTIYSDVAQPGVATPPAGPGANWAESPTVGEGYGPNTNQFALGRAGSAHKRRLVCWMHSTVAFEVGLGTCDPNGSNWIAQYVFDSLPRAYLGATALQVVSFESRHATGDHGSQGGAMAGGIMLPPGYIQIRVNHLAAPGENDLIVSLSFLGS